MGITSKSIHLRLPKNLHKKIQKLKESLGFSNIQEFLRDLLRKQINNKK